MKKTLNKGDFWDLFKNQAIVLAELPAGKARKLAERVNLNTGHGDATLHSKAEFQALFELLYDEVDNQAVDGALTLKDGAGKQTATGKLVATYLQVAKSKEDFFNRAMYMVVIEGWPEEHMTPEDPVYADGTSSLSAWATDPGLPIHLPQVGAEGVLLQTDEFSLKNSGNRTLRAPKRSWKVNFKVKGGEGKVLGMWRFNLKAMYNDPSQMREALAWHLFDRIGIPASRHTYAKLAINGRYLGLFSLIEQVDKAFLRDHFGKNDDGNMYKAYCGNVGCATLEYKPSAAADDSGLQYYLQHDDPDLTYRLKTNEDEPQANDYADLALFIRTLNGIDIAGGDEKFAKDAYHDAMEDIMNVKAFLRWAGANLLMGSWDNYYATPANYYLYNSGRLGAAKDFMESPYFYWIPWDYDNSFGIDYFHTQWQYTDLLDWAANTRNYYNGNGTANIPLVQNLLKHDEFVQYYLDHLEHMLDSLFNPETFDHLMGGEGDGGLWDRVRQAAYLESDSPHGQPFTGRQFSNHQVYLNALKQYEINSWNYKVEGIIHYVRMRYDSARQQLQTLRQHYPSGGSGETFSALMEMPPKSV